MESAIKQSSLIRSTQGIEEHLANIQKVQSRGNLNCYRFEGKHLSQNCPFKDKECFFCHKQGHITKVCKAKKKISFIQRKANLVKLNPMRMKYLTFIKELLEGK